MPPRKYSRMDSLFFVKLISYFYMFYDLLMITELGQLLKKIVGSHIPWKMLSQLDNETKGQCHSKYQKTNDQWGRNPYHLKYI